MSTPILATKLYVPPSRPDVVRRFRLVERLNEGLHRKLTLVSAPAGFGKTTLVSEWVAGSDRAVAWLSLDEGDRDLKRFLAYLVAALQTVTADIGDGVLRVLQSPQPPPAESMLTALLNELATVEDDFVLVLDDYHVADAEPVDRALAFLLDHLPPQVHLVVATREDPRLPLARLRVRDQLNEVRASDLRFTPAEAAGFLNQVMGLHLSAEDIAALETRTEGWIAGLQLAAISLQGREDAAGFIASFTGSHRFVLDYLVEEVLHRQPEGVQAFLLQTSILDRLCSSLCDAVVDAPPASGRETLDYLERANLFIVPLDDERRWYRYHHLFADLLRQRLHQRAASAAAGAVGDVAELHARASAWYEAHGLDLEAFHHAAAADDVERTVRLIEGAGMPLYFRGAAAPVLDWLASQPTSVLDARPSLWVAYASALLFVSEMTGVEQKLLAAEAALRGVEPNDQTRDLTGHIAAIRATLAVAQQDVDAILAQSRRALAYLHPDNLPVRTATTWTLGCAYELQGDRAAAGQAYAEALSISQAIGHSIITIMATLGLGSLQEVDNQLHRAAETYRRVLQLVGDPPLPVACEAHLGLARVAYEWNDLDAALQHAQQGVQLARQLPTTDRFVACEVFLARLRQARGDETGAAAVLAEAADLVRRHHFAHQMREVAVAQVRASLREGDLAAADRLAQAHDLALSQARVHLARGDASAALAVLEPWRRQVEAKDWADERLKVMILQAVALHAHGEADEAVRRLDEALALAAPGGFVRAFVDEGEPMARLLAEAAARGKGPAYAGTLRAAFEGEAREREDPSAPPADAPAQPLDEPLTERELEVLRLIAEGRSNREIGERLFLALSTIKGHNGRLFAKLQVRRRTEAVARARALGLL